MTSRRRIQLASGVATTIWLLCHSTMAAAQTARETRNNFGFSVLAGAFYSDNVQRTEDKQSDVAATAGLTLDYKRDDRRFNASIASDVEYRRYLRDSYGNDLVGGVTATLNYWLKPERFSWVFEENFGQSYIDVTRAETPANRQNTNYFSTGPDFFMPLGSRTELSGQARWSQAVFEQDDLNNSHRLTGDLGLIRKLSERTSVSLHGAGGRVTYNDLDNSDFDVRAAYLGFDGTGAHTTLSTELGWNEVEVANDKSGGLLANFTATREIGSRSAVSLSAGTGFSDSADEFRREQRITGVRQENDRTPITPDPYRSDFATLAWDLHTVRGGAAFAVDWRKDSHQQNRQLDRMERGFRAGYTHRLSPVTRLSLDAAWLREAYDTQDINYSEWSVGPGLEWIFARKLTLLLRYDYYHGSGDASGQVDVRDYTENRITLQFSFGARHR